MLRSCGVVAAAEACRVCAAAGNRGNVLTYVCFVVGLFVAALPFYLYQDFLAAVRNVRPSVSRDNLGRFEEWSSKFGTQN